MNENNTNSVSVEKLRYVPTGVTTTSTVYSTDSYMEVVTASTQNNNLANYRRYDKNHYVDRSTGALMDYKSYPTGSASSLSRTFNSLRRLILANFSVSTRGTLLTLTLGAAHEASLASIYGFYCRFWKTLRRNLPQAEYIAVVDVHQSGRLHLHVLLKCRDGPMPKLDMDWIRTSWAVGNAHLVRIYNPPGLCAYLTSTRKRLMWRAVYQPYAKLYRTSRGIVKPNITRLDRIEVGELVKARQLHFDSGYIYRVQRHNSDGTVSTLNTITREEYKK